MNEGPIDPQLQKELDIFKASSANLHLRGLARAIEEMVREHNGAQVLLTIESLLLLLEAMRELGLNVISPESMQ